jgi:hypothetical protein
MARVRLFRLIPAAPLFCLLSGCGASHARFTPTSTEARSSLEAALTAWRDGQPFGRGRVEATPPIQVADSIWQAGRQIESFQIGDEQDGGDGTKQFNVKVRMKQAKADTDVRYVVQGRDPVWVCRAEDYQRLINMDNNPVVPESKSGARRAGRPR